MAGGGIFVLICPVLMLEEGDPTGTEGGWGCERREVGGVTGPAAGLLSGDTTR